MFRYGWCTPSEVYCLKRNTCWVVGECDVPPPREESEGAGELKDIHPAWPVECLECGLPLRTLIKLRNSNWIHIHIKPYIPRNCELPV